jgi:hypothetical protein
MGPQSDIMFTFGPIFIVVVFVVVVGVILFAIINGIKQWSNNNQQPVLTVACKIVGKRTDVNHSSNHQNENMHSSTSTTYYTTFEVESGDRIELRIADQEYGQLAEGDQGKLTFQGTRYLGFVRQAT